MSFIWPAMLLLLLLVPLFGLLYLGLQRRRRRIAASYGAGLWGGARGRPAGLRRHIPPLFFLAGLTILLIALARPRARVSLPIVEGTVILAFDVSGSMAADDLQPTRMEAAKVAALEFIERQPPSVQVGVVAFSDSGFMVQMPTNDAEALRASIDRLKPQRGTSLGQGILASLSAIQGGGDQTLQSEVEPPTPTPVPEGSQAPAIIVLLTDGEDNSPPDPFEAAQQSADRGVRIYPIGIGSAQGATLHIDGFTVHTQLDEAMLQGIAQLTGGSYYNAQNDQELHQVYENISPQLVIKPEEIEVTSLFAGASLLVMMVGAAFSLFWFSRIP